MNHETQARLLERLRKPFATYSVAPAMVIRTLCFVVTAFTLTLLGLDALEVRKQVTKALPLSPIADTSAPTAAISTPISLAELGAMNLTGIPFTPTPQAAPTPAPKPRDEVRLVGTITDSESQLASALISVGGQPAKRVFVGEAINEEMTLRAVSENSAEYSYANATLTLHFPFSDIQDMPQMQNRQRRQMELQTGSVATGNNDVADEVNAARKNLERFRARKGNNEN